MEVGKNFQVRQIFHDTGTDSSIGETEGFTVS